LTTPPPYNVGVTIFVARGGLGDNIDWGRGVGGQ